MIESIFYPTELTETLRENADRAPWAAGVKDRIVADAAPWLARSDEELWSSMFGPTLKRSWHVWSSGHCPACKGDVPMYDWVIEPDQHAWKVACPHCSELFPKNDFHAYYESGLDSHGVFDHALADRSLLVADSDGHEEGFGIDDGNGWSDGENAWMFIPAYLIYGQWKQVVHGGILKLADAYTLTGDPVYARKAGILIDRVADLYPDFDFAEQGWLYEKKPDFGYVTNWHDACKEVRQLANAYDQVKPSLAEDADFLDFVQSQRDRGDLPFEKSTFEDVAGHIETRIFRDTIENVHKIKSNFPGQEVALITMEAVLSGTLDTTTIEEMMDAMISEAVAIDGVTGEKGLENYSAGVLQVFAEFLGMLERRAPGFLKRQMERHPDLARTYRFHLDTWCLENYYPSIGDSGTFASEAPEYRGLSFSTDVDLTPSTFSFAWALCEATGDLDYARLLYRANGRSVNGLPYDLTCPDPKAMQSRVDDAISKGGDDYETGSIDFPEWHLAILRSGTGTNARAVSLSYDTGRRHGHLNGLSLGLFAHGLDLLPDFGYLPVHRGGWQGPHVDWYKGTAAHNTVLVDGQNQHLDTEGETTLWQTEDGLHAIRVAAPSVYGIPGYMRTCLLVDVDDAHFYVIDLFDVEGGTEHTFFLHGPDSTLSTSGLELEDDEPFGHGTIMRADRWQSRTDPGWSVTWKQAEQPVSVRYTGLSHNLAVGTAESWVSKGKWTNEDLWIPTLMIQKRGNAPLSTGFVGIIEAFAGEPIVSTAVCGVDEDAVLIEVALSEGRSHSLRIGTESVEIERS